MSCLNICKKLNNKNNSYSLDNDDNTENTLKKKKPCFFR